MFNSSNSSLDKQVSKTIRKETNAPAIYYSMMDANQVLYSYKEGFSDILNQTEVSDSSQFALFSITKPFTAIAILQLQEQGKLSIDDLASTYLPQYDFLEDVSIRQLLAHQSGLNNPLPMKWIHLESEATSFDSKKFSSSILLNEAKQKSKPGSKSSYSNLNYLALGELIEQVSGMTYREYMESNVINGIEGIGFSWKSENAAKGYHSRGFQSFILGFLIDKEKYADKEENEDFFPFKSVYMNGEAYGGLIANAKGLTQFIQLLLSPKSEILTESSKSKLFTEQILSDGDWGGHSLGWFSDVQNGTSYVCHAGGGGGFYTELRIYPNKGIASLLLTNKSGFSDERILSKVDPYLFNSLSISDLTEL